MSAWHEFTRQAPTIAELFRRRHAQPVLPVDPPTRRGPADQPDPHVELHTATVDTHIGEADVKGWDIVDDEQDLDLHAALAEHLYATIGFDLRGRRFAPFYVADIQGASAICLDDDHMIVTAWSPIEGEREIQKT
ncbi:hypothetical protein HNP40_002341 [Mycobacteroides chelonae]|nr:hypothetical protein [Mycobacteroides chelonae]